METYNVMVFVPHILIIYAKYFQNQCAFLFFFQLCEISIIFLFSPYFIGASESLSSNDLTKVT